MTDKKIKKISIELSPVQMVWLHSQHLFQKIEQNSQSKSHEVKFFKNNSGVEVRFQYCNEQQDFEHLLQAKQQLLKIISQNQIRLMNTSLHKDLYIRISKEARKQFPKSYIIFLHYQTFENCCRKLNQKFNITSITPQLEKLRKSNHYFCFLIAEKSKIDDIEKFTMRILHSEVSCASTTFSHHNPKRQQTPNHKRTMSVSSLKGSFSDQNEEQCRLSIYPAVTEEQMFQISQTALVNLNQDQIQQICRTKKYCGSKVCIQKFEGNYLGMKKKLYYTNRLQLTSSSHIQQVYAYSMIQKNLNRWVLYFVTDHKYRTIQQIFRQHWFNYKIKLEILLKIGKAIVQLHRHNENYGNLTMKNVLIDYQKNIYLNCFITKDIPPYTDPLEYDICQYLMLIYQMFTEMEISYQLLMKKFKKQDFFCTLSHKTRNSCLKQYLEMADQLFIHDISLPTFLKKSGLLLKNT